MHHGLVVEMPLLSRLAEPLHSQYLDLLALALFLTVISGQHFEPLKPDTCAYMLHVSYGVEGYSELTEAAFELK